MRAAAVILVLVATAWLPGPTLAQSAPPVVELVMLGPVPSWIGNGGGGLRPGEVGFETVVHAGSAPLPAYSLQYEWRSAGAARPLNEDAARSLDAGGPLAAGESRTHEGGAWRLQPGQHGAGQLVIRMQANTTEHVTVQTLHVAVHDLRLEPDTVGRSLERGGVVGLPFTVRNLGNVAQPVVVRLDEDPEGFQQRLLPTVRSGPEGDAALVWSATLAPGAAAGALLRVRGGAGIGDGPQPFSIFARSSHQEIESSLVVQGIASDAPIAALPTLAAAATQTLFADPGGAVSASFFLRNPGPVAESYAFTASGSSGWVPRTVRVGGSATDEVIVEAGAGVVATVDGTAPDAAPGTPGALLLTVSGTTGSATAARSTRIHGPALAIGAGTNGRPAYLGDEAQVTWTVRNVGDRVTPAHHQTTRLVTADGSAEALEVPVGPIDPGEQVTMSATFRAPQVAGTARLLIAAAGAGPPASAEAAVDVRRADFRLTPPAGLGGVPGESVTYQAPPHMFRLRNDGTAREEFELAAAGPGVELVGPSRLHLDPGEQADIGLVHHLPLPAGDQPSFGLGLSAALANAPHRVETAFAATVVHDRSAPSLAWLTPLPAAWPTGADLPVRFTATDGTQVADAWVTTDRANLTASPIPGGALQATVHVLPGDMTVTVWAKDVRGNVARLSSTLTGADRVPPQVVELTMEGDGPVRRVRATVMAPGPLAQLILFVDGLPTHVDADGGVVVIDVEMSHGRHVLRLVAIGADGLTGSQTLTVDVPAPSAPTALAERAGGKEAAGPMAWVGGLAMLASARLRQAIRDKVLSRADRAKKPHAGLVPWQGATAARLRSMVILILAASVASPSLAAASTTSYEWRMEEADPVAKAIVWHAIFQVVHEGVSGDHFRNGTDFFGDRDGQVSVQELDEVMRYFEGTVPFQPSVNGHGVPPSRVGSDHDPDCVGPVVTGRTCSFNVTFTFHSVWAEHLDVTMRNHPSSQRTMVWGVLSDVGRIAGQRNVGNATWLEPDRRLQGTWDPGHRWNVTYVLPVASSSGSPSSSTSHSSSTSSDPDTPIPPSGAEDTPKTEPTGQEPASQQSTIADGGQAGGIDPASSTASGMAEIDANNTGVLPPMNASDNGLPGPGGLIPVLVLGALAALRRRLER